MEDSYEEIDPCFRVEKQALKYYIDAKIWHKVTSSTNSRINLFQIDF